MVVWLLRKTKGMVTKDKIGQSATTIPIWNEAQRLHQQTEKSGMYSLVPCKYRETEGRDNRFG